MEMEKKIKHDIKNTSIREKINKFITLESKNIFESENSI